MTFATRFTKQGNRDFDQLERREMLAIDEALGTLEADPRPNGAIRLKGDKEGRLRLRVGDFRVIYSIDDDAKMITVHLVRDRKEAYK